MKHSAATLQRKRERMALVAVLPMLVFTIVFIVGPLFYLVLLSFQTRAEGIGVEHVLTLQNYRMIWQEPVYRKVFLNSIVVALITTLLVALLGYPVGYFVAKLAPRVQVMVTALLLIPFWVNSLLRIQGWKILLRDGGFFSSFPQWLHITKEPVMILDTYLGVYIGLVYALLPMMIFSVYSSVQKMDWTLVEAARDLGASRSKAFWDTVFPLSLPGLLSGVILTFIPSMGLVLVVELLGGNRILLIGNVIKQSAQAGHNLPFAAALAVVLIALTTLCLVVYRKLFRAEQLEGMV